MLRCKKEKFRARDRERLRRQGELRAELEEMLEKQRQQDLDLVAEELHRGKLGQVEASERSEEVRGNYEKKINSLRTVFEIAEPQNNTPREIPDHLVDMITFEPMHDPVITKNGMFFFSFPFFLFCFWKRKFRGLIYHQNVTRAANTAFPSILNYRALLRASDNIRAFETYTHRSPHQVSHHHALTNKKEIPRVDSPPQKESISPLN